MHMKPHSFLCKQTLEAPLVENYFQRYIETKFTADSEKQLKVMLNPYLF